MDPNKPASAPPAGWTDEKPPMDQNPPYYDITGQGYPPSSLGYPPSGLGYPPSGLGYPPQPQGFAVYGQQQQYPMGQQDPAQPATVTVQPAVYMTHAPLPNPYTNYLCYSVFTMLFCCLPLGVAALVFSLLTREANLVGNQMEAERNSRLAKILNHIALGIGISISVIVIVYIVVMLSFVN